MPDLLATRRFLGGARPLSLHARLGIALIVLERWWRGLELDSPDVDGFLDYCWRFSATTGATFMDWHDHEHPLFSVAIDDRARTPPDVEDVLRGSPVDAFFLRTQLQSVALLIAEGLFCQPDERLAFERLARVVHALAEQGTPLPPLAPFEPYRLACCMLGPFELRPTRLLGPFLLGRRGDWGDQPPPDVLAAWRAHGGSPE